MGGWEAGSQTVKPGSRPRALFTVAIPAQFHCPFLAEAVNTAAAAAAAHQTPDNQVAAVLFFQWGTLQISRHIPLKLQIKLKVSYDSACSQQSLSSDYMQFGQQQSRYKRNIFSLLTDGENLPILLLQHHLVAALGCPPAPHLRAMTFETNALLYITRQLF